MQLPWRVGGLQLRLQDCLADVAYTATILATMHDRAAAHSFQSLQYMETHLRHGRSDAPVPAVKGALDSWRGVWDPGEHYGHVTIRPPSPALRKLLRVRRPSARRQYYSKHRQPNTSNTS